MKQKDIFLESEGNAWLNRNRKAISSQKLPDDDQVLGVLEKLIDSGFEEGSVLEIGCSDGTRLAWIKENLSFDCYGIDPSSEAIADARKKGINAQQGTADILPFNDKYFDIVIFGFCLYLCDREDLFRIAEEANRVLAPSAWLIIQDFYSIAPRDRQYSHCAEIRSYKMDFRKLFDWHPHYTCVSHEIKHHAKNAYTDDVEEWVSLSVLRKISATSVQ